MIKFGFKIKTRGGMIVDNLLVAARDRPQAEAKLTQIYHNCQILDCQELRQTMKEDAIDLESAINLIGKEGPDRGPAR